MATLSEIITDVLCDETDMEEDEAQNLTITLCATLAAILEKEEDWHRHHIGESGKGALYEGGFCDGIAQAHRLLCN